MFTKHVHPLTRAEKSSYEATSRHADVMEFIQQLKQRNDRRLFVTNFGKSAEERDLPLLVLSASGVSTSEQAKNSELPIVLVNNGIHAGEVEGKEGSLMLARDLLLNYSMGELLNHMILLIVPLLNPDGNDRISTKNRPLNIEYLEGQDGPNEVGTRENAAKINLNRDYMKQAAVEMRLFQTQVCQKWQPHLTIDCHTTNGSIHRYAMTYDIPHTVESGRFEPIAFMREQLLPVVTQRFNRKTGLDSFYYGNFITDEKGTEPGWRTYPHHPRFGSNYRGLTNRLDLLLETYSYIDFHARVFTSYKFLVEVLKFVAERGRDIIEVVESSQRPPERIAVQYTLEPFPSPVEILTRSPYNLAGQPVTVTVPHHARFVGKEVIQRPWAYAVPEAVAQNLRQHGLVVKPLQRDYNALVEVAQVESVVVKSQENEILPIIELPPEGEVQIQANYQQETRTLVGGTFLVETEQPLGAIAVYLCEANSDDGIVANGIITTPTPGLEFPVLRVLERMALR